MRFPQIRPRLPFLALAVAAVGGIIAADRWVLPASVLFGAALVAGAVVLASGRALFCWVFTAVVFAGLHTLREAEHPARLLANFLGAHAEVVRATGVVWREPEPLPFWAGQQTGRFPMKLEQMELRGSQLGAGHLVQVTWAGPLPAYGDRVTLVGSARNIQPVRNPGQFDFPAYLRRRGIYSEIDARFAVDCQIQSSGHGEAIQALANRARRWLQAELARDLDDSPEIASLITSMVLGLRGDTPEEMQELFRRTGTLHLFAVSGLNIAMLALIAWFILKPLGVRRRAAVFAIVPILAAYAIVTGLSASCVRAAIMGALVVMGQLFDRRALVYNSLAAAAVLILAWDTNQLFSLGFQFSFVLVFTIVWLSRIIQHRLERLGLPDPFLPRPLWSVPQRTMAAGGKLLGASLGVTLSAWIGSLLFTAGYFHLFSPSAILANMGAVPLAFIILALGLGSALTATFSKGLVVLFNNANWFCAKALLWLVNAFAFLPGGHVYVELPRFAPSRDCEFTVLDLGSGAAIHLRAGGADWLIDGGPTLRYRQVTLPYLRSRGVNLLDAFLITHGDAQHIGCADSLVDDFAPRRIFDSPVADRSPTRKAFRRTLAQRQKGVAFCQRGDVFELSPGTTLRVLHPPAGLRRSAADDKALVLLLDNGLVRTLFTSDSGFLTEQSLLEQEPELRVDLLVRGQHAKELSGTPDFLARLAPQVAVCASPGYGESRERIAAWTRQSEARGITVFSQEQCGAVSVEMHGRDFIVRSFLNGQTFRSRAR